MIFDEEKFLNSTMKVLSELDVQTQKIHIQKFVSYLADTIDDVPFNFSIYTYGPFCKELSVKLDAMVAWGDLKYEKKSYALADDSSKFLTDNEERSINQKINDYIALLPSYDFADMELYGTMHYYMTRTKPLEKASVVEKFKIAKEDKFPDAKIEESFTRLETLFAQKHTN